MAVASRANSDYGRFVDEVKDMSLFPLWERTGGLKPGSSCVPAHWSYSTVRPQLLRACDLITKKERDFENVQRYLAEQQEELNRRGQELKQTLDRFGILLVADEIQMGFFRTGKFMAIEHFDVVPDVIVFGKAMTNVIFRFLRVSSSLSSMRRSTRPGTRPPRRPEKRILTPRSWSSARRRSRMLSLKFMRKRTSSSGRRQFSVEKA